MYVCAYRLAAHYSCMYVYSIVCVCRYSYLVSSCSPLLLLLLLLLVGNQPPPPAGEGVSGGGGGSRVKSSKRRKSTGKRRSRRFGRRSSVALINFSDGSPATTAKVRHTHTLTCTCIGRSVGRALSGLLAECCGFESHTHTNAHSHSHTHCPSLSLSLSFPR